MALSEGDRPLVEKLYCAAQAWADSTLIRLCGQDRPYETEDESAPSTIEYALSVKSDSVEKLSRLRAGDPMSEIFD